LHRNRYSTDETAFNFRYRLNVIDSKTSIKSQSDNRVSILYRFGTQKLTSAQVFECPQLSQWDHCLPNGNLGRRSRNPGQWLVTNTVKIHALASPVPYPAIAAGSGASLNARAFSAAGSAVRIHLRTRSGRSIHVFDTPANPFIVKTAQRISRAEAQHGFESAWRA
jgi:hypothetical protein